MLIYGVHAFKPACPFTWSLTKCKYNELFQQKAAGQLSKGPYGLLTVQFSINRISDKMNLLITVVTHNVMGAKTIAKTNKPNRFY